MPRISDKKKLQELEMRRDFFLNSGYAMFLLRFIKQNKISGNLVVINYTKEQSDDNYVYNSFSFVLFKKFEVFNIEMRINSERKISIDIYDKFNIDHKIINVVKENKEILDIAKRLYQDS